MTGPLCDEARDDVQETQVLDDEMIESLENAKYMFLGADGKYAEYGELL